MDRELAEAIALAQAGRLSQAIAALDRLVARAPHEPTPRYNLAVLLLQTGRLADGLAHLEAIVARHPAHGPALFSKARALVAMGRPAEAVPILRRLGNDPDVLLALSHAYRLLGQAEQAVATLRGFTDQWPDHVAGHVNLGILLAAIAPEQGIEAMQRATARHPEVAQLHGLHGQCLMRAGRLAEAATALERSLALDPALAASRGHLLRVYREMAEWDKEDQVFADLRAAMSKAGRSQRALLLATQDALFFPFSGDELLQLAEAEARFRVPQPPSLPARPQPAGRPPLVIGYLSPDFRDHATMHLAGEVFGHHDRTRVKVMAYSLGPDDGSGWRERIARQSDAFADLSTLPDGAAADRIAADGVHVLVDMSVYTRHARPGIAALRPAPVQVAWLGLAASSGAPWIDYALVDRVLVPPEHRSHFSESLVYLPHSYQANGRLAPLAPPPVRADLGLPPEAMVFCSFNGHRKLDRNTFALWLDILGSVPDAVLWMLDPPAATRQRLERVAGPLAGRLVWAPLLGRDRHLARLPAADLCLDALVCGAHTTAADALRVGVPLVTVAGERLASRVAASLLTALGLTELVAADAAALKALAITLGTDRVRLGEVRRQLAEALPRSPVFDPAGFARHLETAYELMWQRHVAAAAPDDLVVPA